MVSTGAGQTILGIDYGERNIGLAFGRAGLVSPIKTISGKNIQVAMNEISLTVLNNKVDKIIIGLPLDLDGKETFKSLKVRRFANLLKNHIKKPIEFVNEYNTTFESLRESINLNYSKKSRKNLDHISAAVIARKYFESANED